MAPRRRLIVYRHTDVAVADHVQRSTEGHYTPRRSETANKSVRCQAILRSATSQVDSCPWGRFWRILVGLHGHWASEARRCLGAKHNPPPRLVGGEMMWDDDDDEIIRIRILSCIDPGSEV